MKAILLGICILFAANGFSQSVIIRGKVIDKSTRQPVIGASIVLPNGTGTSSDANGDFKFSIGRFPVTLTISHVSYGKMEVPLPSDPKKQIIIELEELVSDIGEVQVTGTKLRNLTEKDDFTLQDFAFDKENLWLLGYMKNQATQGRLWLANLFGDTLKSVPVQNPERLYNDVFGIVHLVDRDSVYQVFNDGHEIVFPYSFDRTSFFRTMSPIVAAFSGNLVYQSFLPNQQGLHTYYYNGLDQKPYFLNSIRDTSEESRQLIEHVFGPGLYLIEAMQSEIPKIKWEAVNAVGRNKMSKSRVVNRRISVPVFSLMDTLYIVNLYKDSLIAYDTTGRFIRAVPINFHLDSVLFDVKFRDIVYLEDPISHRMYLLQRTTAQWTMVPFEPSTGRTGEQIPLPDFPGMRGIKVNGHSVYFLYPEKKYPYYVRLYRYQL